ncbi:hypothetical protein GQ600_5546 [Phytophthora cactorum]|nr:hypothetical protein GQ600_5546 [Phytophthora cactorum]
MAGSEPNFMTTTNMALLARLSPLCCGGFTLKHRANDIEQGDSIAFSSKDDDANTCRRSAFEPSEAADNRHHQPSGPSAKQPRDDEHNQRHHRNQRRRAQQRHRSRMILSSLGQKHRCVVAVARVGATRARFTTHDVCVAIRQIQQSYTRDLRVLAALTARLLARLHDRTGFVGLDNGTATRLVQTDLFLSSTSLVLALAVWRVERRALAVRNGEISLARLLSFRSTAFRVRECTLDVEIRRGFSCGLVQHLDSEPGHDFRGLRSLRFTVRPSRAPVHSTLTPSSSIPHENTEDPRSGGSRTSARQSRYLGMRTCQSRSGVWTRSLVPHVVELFHTLTGLLTCRCT